jgi:hypothetical protein
MYNERLRILEEEAQRQEEEMRNVSSEIIVTYEFKPKQRNSEDLEK